MPTIDAAPVNPVMRTNVALSGFNVALPLVTAVLSSRPCCSCPSESKAITPVTVAADTVEPDIVPPVSAPIVPPLDTAVAIVEALIVAALI